MTEGSPQDEVVERADNSGIICPRCDYSLRGIRSARCPECGYEIRWDEIRGIDEARSTGFFEYSASGHAKRDLIRTWWWALWPTTFWQWATPSWPVRTRRILTFVLVTTSATIFTLTVVMTAVAYGAVSWRYGAPYSLISHARAYFPFFAFASVGSVLPCLIAGLVFWAVGAIVTASPSRRRFIRVVAYPTAFLPLLTLAVPLRIVSTLFTYASRPQADWSVLFWWLRPNFKWSRTTYIYLIEANWCQGEFEWSNPLRIVTLCAVVAACIPYVVRKSSSATLVRYLGLVTLILLWPVTMVYAGWLFSIVIGARAYLPARVSPIVEAVTCVASVILLLMIDMVFGGRALLDILLVWP